MLKNKNTKQVALIGYNGHGKTSLFNKICKNNQAVQFGGPSVTRESVLSQSAYGEGFNLLDTPGLRNDKDRFAHVVCQTAALTVGQIHQILIVVQLERLGTIKEKLRLMIQQFKRFKDIITVAVTHWDKAEEPEQRKKELVDLLQGYNVKSLMLVSKETTGKELCQMIEGILQRCEQQGKSCQLSQAEFYSLSDIIDLQDDEVFEQLNQQKEQVKYEFQKIVFVIKSFINKFSETDPTMPEVMHQLTLAIEEYADEKILKFQKDNINLFNNLYSKLQDEVLCYLIDAQLKLEFVTQVNCLISLAQQKMKHSQQQCFNYIKQCPYCGEIWRKVFGCEDQTFCGKVPQNEADQFKQQKFPRRFKFSFQEFGVTYNDLGISFLNAVKGNQLEQQIDFLNVKQLTRDKADTQQIQFQQQPSDNRQVISHGNFNGQF